jgi:hypothetical protein
MAKVSVLWRTFATRSSACVGPMDQRVASGCTLPLPALRMAWTLGEAGMRSIERAGAPMHVKDAQVEIDKTTKCAVIHDKRSKCYWHVRRPLISFRRLGYVCKCGAALVAPS